MLATVFVNDRNDGSYARLRLEADAEKAGRYLVVLYDRYAYDAEDIDFGVDSSTLPFFSRFEGMLENRDLCDLVVVQNPSYDLIGRAMCSGYKRAAFVIGYADLVNCEIELDTDGAMRLERRRPEPVVVASATIDPYSEDIPF